MGEIFGGRYELVDPLGRGGSGDVWRVWDHRRSQYLAGKVLQQSDSASLLRFVRETGWRFDHPHIVAPLGWVGEDDRVMFAMPLVHGGAISTLLSDRGPLSQAYVAAVADQVLDALEIVHGAGLVHRDVKPANILMEPTPTGFPDARLADFGIAAKMGEPRMTRIAEVVGTPGFMSPEAQLGADPDPAQDIYALGVLMIQLLTGNRSSGEAPPPLPDHLRTCPLGGFIGVCLADVAHRYASASEARRALAPILATMGPARVSVPDRTPPLPPRWGPGGPNSSTAPLPNRGLAGGPRSPMSGSSAPSGRMPVGSPGPVQPGSVQSGLVAPIRRGPWPAAPSPAGTAAPAQPSPSSGSQPRPPAAGRPGSAIVAPPGASGSGRAGTPANRPVAPAPKTSKAAPRDIVLGAGIAAGAALVVILILLLTQ